MSTADRFKKEAIELSWTANAYLDCAQRLCKALIDEEYERSIHHNRFPLHLAFLALELWFKAGLAAAQRPYPKHHDLAKLRQLYLQAMPDIPLSLPSFFEKLIPTSRDLFEERPAPDLEYHFARLRYSSDRRGQPYPELAMADLSELRDELENPARATHAAQMRIWKKYGWNA